MDAYNGRLRLDGMSYQSRQYAWEKSLDSSLLKMKEMLDEKMSNILLDINVRLQRVELEAQENLATMFDEKLDTNMARPSRKTERQQIPSKAAKMRTECESHKNDRRGAPNLETDHHREMERRIRELERWKRKTDSEHIQEQGRRQKQKRDDSVCRVKNDKVRQSRLEEEERLKDGNQWKKQKDKQGEETRYQWEEKKRQTKEEIQIKETEGRTKQEKGRLTKLEREIEKTKDRLREKRKTKTEIEAERKEKEEHLREHKVRERKKERLKREEATRIWTQMERIEQEDKMSELDRINKTYRMKEDKRQNRKDVEIDGRRGRLEEERMRNEKEIEEAKATIQELEAIKQDLERAIQTQKEMGSERERERLREETEQMEIQRKKERIERLKGEERKKKELEVARKTEEGRLKELGDELKEEKNTQRKEEETRQKVEMEGQRGENRLRELATATVIEDRRKEERIEIETTRRREDDHLRELTKTNRKGKERLEKQKERMKPMQNEQTTDDQLNELGRTNEKYRMNTEESMSIKSMESEGRDDRQSIQEIERIKAKDGLKNQTERLKELEKANKKDKDRLEKGEKKREKAEEQNKDEEMVMERRKEFEKWQNKEEEMAMERRRESDKKQMEIQRKKEEKERLKEEKAEKKELEMARKREECRLKELEKENESEKDRLKKEEKKREKAEKEQKKKEDRLRELERLQEEWTKKEMLAKEQQKQWEEILERNNDSVKEKKWKAIVGAVDKVYHKACDWGEKKVELVKDAMKERAQEHQKRLDNIESQCLERLRNQQEENASGIQHTLIEGHVSNTGTAQSASMAASSISNSHEGCTTSSPPAQPPAPRVRSKDCKSSTRTASPAQPSGPNIPEMADPPAKPSCSITTGPPAQPKGPDMLPLTTPPVQRDPEASPDTCTPVQYIDSKCLPVTDPTTISNALLMASPVTSTLKPSPRASQRIQSNDPSCSLMAVQADELSGITNSVVTAIPVQASGRKGSLAAVTQVHPNSPQGSPTINKDPLLLPKLQETPVTAVAAQPDASKSNPGTAPAQQSSSPAQSGPNKAPGNAPSAQTKAKSKPAEARKEAFKNLTTCKDYSIFCVEKK